MLESIYRQKSGTLNGQEYTKPTETPEENKAVCLPDSVYQQLPELLQNACGIFTDRIDRDVFLMGALAVLSGILPNVYGIYDNKKVGANLYVFIVAAAGSGKGSLSWVRKLIHPIHQYLRDQSTEEKNRMLLIPANNSASGMIEALHNNKEKGILMCTEADTLSGALSQDWGNYSDVMRAGFHHEFYEMMRRGNKEYFELKRPHLSILLSGTHAQVVNLIPNAENGLLSRFCFYTFESSSRMKNVFAAQTVDFGSHFEGIGETLLSLYRQLNEEDTHILFDLSPTQKERFLKVFNDWHDEFLIVHGKGSLASIRRLALILFRISMIFSLLHFVQVETLPKEIVCKDADFENALNLIGVLKNHTAKIYAQLSKTKDSNGLNGKKFQFFQMIPDRAFNRAEALQLAEKIDFPRGTLDRFLKTDFLRRSHMVFIKNEKLSK